MGEIRAHVYISGRVQGVLFRDSLRWFAREQGVTGWVRNLRDGRVEAVIEGPREAVEKTVRWCYYGPPRARVEDVQVEWGPSRHEFNDFRIVW
ncbi:MAG TPA: acylphosphatase [Armatimonadetes bacterium]|nr:acylphosphatase [Armatimonadota bacterium]